MNRYRAALVVAVGVLLGSTVCGAEELKLADTSEKLTATEEKAVRRAVEKEGSITGHPDPEKPLDRALYVPKDLQAVYDTKPKATVRLLLKIVEGGSARHSISAGAFIGGLVAGPKYGALTASFSVETWDDEFSEKTPVTRREMTRNGCLRVIIKKEDTKPKDMIPPAPPR